MAYRGYSRLILIVGLVLFSSCRREERRFDEVSPGTNPGLVQQSDLLPGGGPTILATVATAPYDDNAYAMNEGKRLFEWFNCVGCHAHGGGAIGPALSDDEWIYGRDPAQIYNSIAEGRPNGMPSFAGHIQEQQIWQIVSYVRSLNGIVSKDAATGRDDHMKVGTPEAQIPPEPERKTKAAPK
jgi:cytochrome c oxidase cbb3-type subunit 3